MKLVKAVLAVSLGAAIAASSMSADHNRFFSDRC